MFDAACETIDPDVWRVASDWCEERGMHARAWALRWLADRARCPRWDGAEYNEWIWASACGAAYDEPHYIPHQILQDSQQFYLLADAMKFIVACLVEFYTLHREVWHG